MISWKSENIFEKIQKIDLDSVFFFEIIILKIVLISNEKNISKSYYFFSKYDFAELRTENNKTYMYDFDFGQANCGAW